MWLALIILSLLLISLLVLAFVPIPERNDNAFNILLGAMIGYGMAVITFAFPSNVNTQAKDVTIANQAAAIANPITPLSTEESK